MASRSEQSALLPPPGSRRYRRSRYSGGRAAAIGRKYRRLLPSRRRGVRALQEIAVANAGDHWRDGQAVDRQRGDVDHRPVAQHDARGLAVKRFAIVLRQQARPAQQGVDRAARRGDQRGERCIVRRVRRRQSEPRFQCRQSGEIVRGHSPPRHCASGEARQSARESARPARLRGGVSRCRYW